MRLATRQVFRAPAHPGKGIAQTGGHMEALRLAQTL